MRKTAKTANKKFLKTGARLKKTALVKTYVVSNGYFLRPWEKTGCARINAPAQSGTGGEGKKHQTSRRLLAAGRQGFIGKKHNYTFILPNILIDGNDLTVDIYPLPIPTSFSLSRRLQTRSGKEKDRQQMGNVLICCFH